MSIIKKNLIIISIFTLISLAPSKAEELKKIGKFKDWQTMVLVEPSGTVCFAQSSPVLQAPKSNKREARLFVTFRPKEDIKDEVSITSGHPYKSSTVTAKSGKNSFSFFSQEDFAWLLDEKEEKNFIKTMKRATNLIVTANMTNGAQTVDHYSMMGFTKAYNTAKKSCS